MLKDCEQTEIVNIILNVGGQQLMGVVLEFFLFQKSCKLKQKRNKNNITIPPPYGDIIALKSKKNEIGILLRLILLENTSQLISIYGGKKSLSLECIFYDNEVRYRPNYFLWWQKFIIS